MTAPNIVHWSVKTNVHEKDIFWMTRYKRDRTHRRWPWLWIWVVHDVSREALDWWIDAYMTPLMNDENKQSRNPIICMMNKELSRKSINMSSGRFMNPLTNWPAIDEKERNKIEQRKGWNNRRWSIVSMIGKCKLISWAGKLAKATAMKPTSTRISNEHSSMKPSTNVVEDSTEDISVKETIDSATTSPGITHWWCSIGWKNGRRVLYSSDVDDEMNPWLVPSRKRRNSPEWSANRSLGIDWAAWRDERQALLSYNETRRWSTETFDWSVGVRRCVLTRLFAISNGWIGRLRTKLTISC